MVFSVVMHLPSDSVGSGIMFLCSPSAAFVSLDRYCYDFDKTAREYSLAPTDDLIRF